MMASFEISPEEREDFKAYLRSGLPFQLGDIVVGDIDNDYDSRLLTKALAGDFKAERDLIRRIAASMRRNAKRRPLKPSSKGIRK